MRRSTAAVLFVGAIAMIPAAPAVAAELSGREVMDNKEAGYS